MVVYVDRMKLLESMSPEKYNSELQALLLNLNSIYNDDAKVLVSDSDRLLELVGGKEVFEKQHIEGIKYLYVTDFEHQIAKV